MVDALETINNRVDQAYQNAKIRVRGGGEDVPGFSTGAIPSANGTNVRQASIPNRRLASATRNMVRWFLPETGIVEMYVNPQNIKYMRKKHIPEPTRTRGGYLIQYWGEELGKLSISGTTGSSGVEGINVLDEVYRTEQVSMDPLALAIEANRDRQAQANLTGNFGDFANNFTAGAVDSLFDSVDNIINTGNVDPLIPKPTLASIAFQVEMYWSGWVFRGYFTSFNVTEKADAIGLFDYDMEFTVTQRRGQRNNFFPWHRSAVNGPSNSDPAFGTPYSFSNLKDPIPRRNIDQDALSRLQRQATSVDRALQSYRAV